MSSVSGFCSDPEPPTDVTQHKTVFLNWRLSTRLQRPGGWLLLPGEVVGKKGKHSQWLFPSSRVRICSRPTAPHRSYPLPHEKLLGNLSPVPWDSGLLE